MKVPTLKAVKAKRVHYKPWLASQVLHRHVVTVYVDVFETDGQRVKATVQQALDEHTGTIQPDDVLEFEAATVVSATLTESTHAKGKAQ